MKNLPIKIKLSIQFSVITGIILLFLGCIIFFSYKEYLLKDNENIIILEYENIKNTINNIKYKNDGFELEEKVVNSIDKATNLGLLVFIYDKNKDIIFSSSSIEFDVDKRINGYFYQNIGNQKYLFYSGNNKKLQIIVGISMLSYLNNLDLLFKIILFGFFITVIISLFISYFFSKKALTSIDTLIKDINIIDISNSENNLNISEKYPNDEIGTLAKSFEIFIMKIKKYIQREKELYQDINHELRTPLMVINTSVELLKMSKNLDLNQQEKLNMIENSSLKMNNLVEELLFLNKSNLNYQEEYIYVGNFLKGIIKNFEYINTNPEINLKLCIKKDFCIKSNYMILDKLFGNILKNSLIYSKKGEILVYVEKNKVSIKDNGIGISKENLEKIFDRFFRVDESRSGGKRGLGLGLSIVKKIIDENKWTLDIKSNIGVGTEFIIYF